MIQPYVQAVYQQLLHLLGIVSRLALPLSIGIGLVAIAGTAAVALRRDREWPQPTDWLRLGATVLGYAALTLISVAAWAVLSTTLPMARRDLAWRQAAEATTHPAPDAPAVYQYGPAVAAVVEHTYTRTLTLPPYLVQQVETQGVGALASYLSDPSAENVLRQVDSFRQRGENVVFTRQVTRRDEDPLPILNSQVQVRFQRHAGRAYDAEFEGRYTFRNGTDHPMTTRFSFPLPEEGTVRDVRITVGGDAVQEPASSGAYEWTGELPVGQQREAVARYRVAGAGLWHYDLGSRRRRVEQFRLAAATGGPVRFQRGSLEPTSNSRGQVTWQLANVVTNQQVAISFPPDTVGQQCYLQALSALPAALVLFLLGMLAVRVRSRPALRPATLAGGLVVFTAGLAATVVLANYIGTIGAVIAGPLAGAMLALPLLGRRSLLATLPAALVPATFLSPQHTGLLLLALALATLSGSAAAARAS